MNNIFIGFVCSKYQFPIQVHIRQENCNIRRKNLGTFDYKKWKLTHFAGLKHETSALCALSKVSRSTDGGSE